MYLDVYIPYDAVEFRGGVKSFLSNIRSFLDRNNYSTAEYAQHSQVIFIPFPLEEMVYLVQDALPHQRIVVRVDGAYFRSDQNTTNRNKILHYFLQHGNEIVFQSEYCARQVREIIGDFNLEHCVIHNGADTNIFQPAAQNIRNTQQPLRIATSGRFRHIDMIMPILHAVELVHKNIPCELLFIGSGVELFYGEQLPLWVSVTGEVTHNEVARLLKKVDLFVYSFLNTPCPNSVIEAASCGIPIAGFATGSMPELLYFNTDLLVSMPNRVIHTIDDMDEIKLANCIQLFANDPRKYILNARKEAPKYDFNVTGYRYVNVLKRWGA